MTERYVGKEPRARKDPKNTEERRARAARPGAGVLPLIPAFLREGCRSEGCQVVESESSAFSSCCVGASPDFLRSKVNAMVALIAVTTAQATPIAFSPLV